MDKLTIIGGGRVGRTLGRLWKRAGVLEIDHVFDKKDTFAAEAREFIGEGESCTSLKNRALGKVVLLAVPDDQIASCAEVLCSMDIEEGAIVFHCSGYHSSQILQCLANRGCDTASVHPVKSFADPQKAAATFSGTPCAAEGTPEAVEYLRQAFGAIGAVLFTVDPDKKRLYHSATVFLSNYVVSLLKVGAEVLGQSGVTQDQSRMVLRALCPEVVENCIEGGFLNSLTGPVSRGDTNTVGGELAVLRKQGEINYQLYKLLGRVALQIVGEGAVVDMRATQEMERLFRFGDTD